MNSRYKTARRWLIFWTLFIGIGAVAGATGMILDPSGKALGMDAMLPYFQVLPFADIVFQDLLFSGYALLIVNGMTNLTAAGLLLAGKKPGIVLGGAFGATLMLWICIQFVVFPLNFMSTIYFIFGLAQAITGYCTWVFWHQEHFQVREEDYPNAGTDHRRLVVYFSRMGYVKRLAYETAQSTGADICAISTPERTHGTLGFLWCGRFAMHRWAMPVEDPGLELEAYDHVTICSPIWAFALAAPVRGFCKMASGRIKEADYILVHHTGGRYESAGAEMDALLGLKATGLRSYRCHLGKTAEITEK